MAVKLAIGWADYTGTMTRSRSPLALLCALAALLGVPAGAHAAAPVNTTPLSPAGWLAGDYVVLLSGTDDDGDFDRMEWLVDGGAIQAPDVDGNATVSGEGVHTLETRAVDTAGNDSGWRPDTVRIDLTDPVDVTAAGTTAWRNAPASVTVVGSDSPSGVQRVEWRLDSGLDQQGPNSSAVAIAGDGEHTLHTRVIDLAGRASAWLPHTIKIDTVLPVDDTAAPGGWQTAPLLVPVTGSDTHSGVAQVRYIIDGGLTQSGFAPTTATVSGDGEHTLQTQVVDNAGNTTGWKAHTIRIDTTAPANQTATASSAWRAGDYSVLVTGADGGSGLLDVGWRVNGGPSSRGPSGLQATLTESGVNAFETCAYDVAGNSSCRTEQARIDKVPPVNTTANAPAGAVGNPYTVPVTGTDAHSGVATVEWRVDDGPIQSGPSGSTATVSGAGDHTLHTRIVDNVGRDSGWRSQTVRIDVSGDVTAPTVGAAVPSGWRTTVATVNISATDGGSGVDRVEWRSDGTGVQSQSGSAATLTVADEGVHDLEVRAVDAAGNVSAWMPYVVRLDFTVPADTTAIGPGWQDASEFVVAGSDAVSGIQQVEYGIDGGPVVTAASGVTVDAGADGVYSVRHRVVDRAGHASPWKTDALRVDTVDPVNTSPVPGGGWLVSALELAVDGTDGGSGIASRQWRLAGGDVLDGPARVDADGVHNLETRVVDAAGNDSGWRSDTVRVDVTAPRNDTSAAPAGWRSTAWTATVAGSDGAGSGVDRIERTLDGGAASTTPAVTVSGDGVHTLRTRVIDAVGHASPWRTDTVRIDSVAPTAALSCPSGWRAAPATCSVTAAGGPSGLRSLTVSVDGGAPRAVTAGGGFAVAADGVHRLELRAVDGAGNHRAAQASVRIDRGAPAAKLSCDDGHCTIAASDALSGVASVAWSVDGGAWQPGAQFEVSSGSVRARVADAAGNAVVSDPVEVAAPGDADSASLPVYLRGRHSSGALIGALSATRGESGTLAVDLRPLAVGRGRYKVELRLKAGKRSKRVRRTVIVGRDGTLPRIRAKLPKAEGRCTVALSVRRRAGRGWRSHATGRLAFGD